MPELRQDPLTQHWVVIAPERGQRPRLFEPPRDRWLERGIDPFLPGNEVQTPPELFAIREDGSAPNTAGWQVRVVPNQYPALRVEASLDEKRLGLATVADGVGAHEVIIETPRHDVDLADLPADHIEKVVIAYTERVRDLRGDFRLRYMTVLRNRGAAAGASLPHAHSQLIATPYVPPIAKARLSTAREFYAREGRSLFAVWLEGERQRGERVVMETEHFLVLTPYASAFPFEVTVFPKRDCHDFTLMTDPERRQFAEVLRNTLLRLRGALNDPPYNYVFFTAPNPVKKESDPKAWSTIANDFRWHVDIVPWMQPIGAGAHTGLFINPVAPEEAAAYLRKMAAD